MGNTISSKIPDGVLYAPGAEPAAIKNRIDRLLRNLMEHIQIKLLLDFIKTIKNGARR